MASSDGSTARFGAASDVAAPAPSRFAIGFDRRDRARLHALWDEVIDSEQWSQGEMTRRFETAWAAWTGAGAVGLNFRMSEFTAALGLVQTERMEDIVTRKNAVAREQLDPGHPWRLKLPDGMTSGLYKYIVFDPIERSTGKVYAEPCHGIMGMPADLPNSDWVGEHHWCAPLYYHFDSSGNAA